MNDLVKRIWVRRTLALSALILLWEATGWAGLINPLYAAPPSEVAALSWGLFADGSIWPHLQATFSAALLGLAVGLAIGIVLGFAAALIPLLAALLEPVMLLLNAVPRVILAPLFVIWMGIDLGSKVALATVLVAVLIFFAVYSGVREVDQRLVERVRTLGGGKAVLVREVYVPSVVSWVMGNLKVAVGFAFTGAVVGEFIVANAGLGFLINLARSQFDTPLVFVAVITLALMAGTLYAAVSLLERRLLAWQKRGH